MKSSLSILILFLFSSPLLAQNSNPFGSFPGNSSHPLVPDYSNYSPSFYSQESTPVRIAPDAEERKKERETIETRRTLLNWHQGLGLLTWGFWLATNLAGEKSLSHLHKEYEPFATFFLAQNPQQNLPVYTYLMQVSPWDGDPGGSTHKSLAGTTFTLYALTAGLAFFSPSKSFEREEGLSTIFTHKAMIWIHLPAMLALPFIGQQIPKDGHSAADTMRTVGWAGFSAFTVSIAVFYF
ncbi:hypothetical protein [Leptospira wolffii]|uniref:hypothetical protein n=1 Tax=Leptospira wolffii TaxID=409998 RepID=UPI00030543A7|nr:hypothetical protein [Leptospira wolffii]EPG67209.1 hypothetical protein LEP1GSC061_1931 [Leptospira wolffii serovar Khorat str. Khorat-H2]